MPLQRYLATLTLAAVIVVMGSGLLATTVHAQSASDGSVAADLTGPCSVQAQIAGVGTLDPAVSGGVYTIPHSGEASYVASIAVEGIDRPHDGAVNVKTPPGIPSIEVHAPWSGLADGTSDSGTVDWDIPSWVPGGVEITVFGFHNDGGQRCEGSLTLKLDGGILDTPVGIGALALTVIGALGMVGAALPVTKQ